MTSEWTGDKDNHIDFRIDDPRWGIETLRNGNRFSEHCDRFTANGRYTPWIQYGSLQDWLVIDCRTPFPRKYNRFIPLFSLWYTWLISVWEYRGQAFASGYASVQILQASTKSGHADTCFLSFTTKGDTTGDTTGGSFTRLFTVSKQSAAWYQNRSEPACDSNIQSNFRCQLLQDYNSLDNKGNAWCPILGAYLDSDWVTASHLFAYKHGQETMEANQEDWSLSEMA